jgi:hypothetical protein
MILTRYCECISWSKIENHKTSLLALSLVTSLSQPVPRNLLYYRKVCLHSQTTRLSTMVVPGSTQKLQLTMAIFAIIFGGGCNHYPSASHISKASLLNFILPFLSRWVLSTYLDQSPVALCHFSYEENLVLIL